MEDLASRFGVKVLRLVDSSVVRVTGEVDIATAPRLRCALWRAVEEGGFCLIVDLQEMGFIDNAGARVMDDIGKRLLRRGGRLVLFRPSPATRRFLALRAELCGPPPWELTGAWVLNS